MEVGKLASKTESKDIPIQQQYLSSLHLRLLELLKERGAMTRDQICEEFRYGKHQVKVSINPDKKPDYRYHKGQSKHHIKNR